VIIPIFKKGDRKQCTNYRGISLLSLPGKVYAKCLWKEMPWNSGIQIGGWTVRISPRLQHHGPDLHFETNLWKILEICL